MPRMVYAPPRVKGRAQMSTGSAVRAGILGIDMDGTDTGAVVTGIGLALECAWEAQDFGSSGAGAWQRAKSWVQARVQIQGQTKLSEAFNEKTGEMEFIIEA